MVVRGYADMQQIPTAEEIPTAEGVLDLASVLAAHRGEAWDERISERGRGRAAGRWDGAKCLEAFLEEIAASSTGLRSRASPARRPDRGRDSRDPLEG